MKKFFFALVLLTLCGIFNFCSAKRLIPTDSGTISYERMSLGGINIFAKPQYVKKIYGEPVRIQNNTTFSTFCYGQDESFRVRFINSALKNAPVAIILISDKNNGIETYDGVHVGMDEDVLKEIYGTPYQIDEADEKNNWHKIYQYAGYGKAAYCFLSFACRDGEIKNITCWYYL